MFYGQIFGKAEGWREETRNSKPTIISLGLTDNQCQH